MIHVRLLESCGYCASDGVPKRSFFLALIVGTVLNLINQGRDPIAFLDKREAVWTRGWLETEIKRRAKTPEGRLLAIFDVFDGWFHKKSFEGCSFINVL